MGLALILLVQLLHREVLIPVEAPSAGRNAQPAKSTWPLDECQEGQGFQARGMERAGCVCEQEYQVCQPLQLSARVNESVTLPCTFAHSPRWGLSSDAQVFWRLGAFHSPRYLFNCCRSPAHTDRDFQGRVSLAREEGQRATASIRITALRESDSQLYFCRVSVKTRQGEQAWQAIHGTNLTVTALPPPPEGRTGTAAWPRGLLAGMSAGAVLLAAAALLGLAMLLLAHRKGHCPRRTQTRRRRASRGQEEKEAEAHEELHGRGAGGVPSGEKPAPPPPPTYAPGLVYAVLVLTEPPNQKRLPRRGGGRAEEESPYAAVRP